MTCCDRYWSHCHVIGGLTVRCWTTAAEQVECILDHRARMLVSAVIWKACFVLVYSICDEVLSNWSISKKNSNLYDLCMVSNHDLTFEGLCAQESKK